MRLRRCCRNTLAAPRIYSYQPPWKPSVTSHQNTTRSFFSVPPAPANRCSCNWSPHVGSETTNPSRAVLTTGADFARDYAHAIETDSLSDFRSKYRRAGLVAIDDLHEIGEKTAAQNELVRTLDVLLANHQRLVVTLPQSPSRDNDAGAGSHQSSRGRLDGSSPAARSRRPPPDPSLARRHPRILAARTRRGPRRLRRSDRRPQTGHRAQAAANARPLGAVFPGRRHLDRRTATAPVSAAISRQR